MRKFKDLVKVAKKQKEQTAGGKECDLPLHHPAMNPVSRFYGKVSFTTAEYWSFSLTEVTRRLYPEYKGASKPVCSELQVLGPIGTLSYLPQFLDEYEQDAVVLLMDQAPIDQWQVLSKRSLQVWGGSVKQGYLIEEHTPQWITDLYMRLYSFGVYLPDTPNEGIMTAQTAMQLENQPQIEATAPMKGIANHTLVNRYEPGQGISAHLDGDAYAHKVPIQSLNSGILLHFWSCYEDAAQGPKKAHTSVYLQPGSQLIFEDNLYTQNQHGIEETHHDIIPLSCANCTAAEIHVGQYIERKPRLSLTMRRVTPVFTRRIDPNTQVSK